MSVSRQSRHFGRAPASSGLPRIADSRMVGRHVSKVPGRRADRGAGYAVGREDRDRNPWLVRMRCGGKEASRQRKGGVALNRPQPVIG
jgi:hypothetical protein